MTIKVFNSTNVPEDNSSKAFSKGAQLDGDVLRDSFILIDHNNSGTEALTFGKTVIYPGCRTGGHSHPGVEEIYYISKGQGTMKVDEEVFDVREGDAFWVEPGRFHVTFNKSKEPLEYIWVLNKCGHTGNESR